MCYLMHILLFSSGRISPQSLGGRTFVKAWFEPPLRTKAEVESNVPWSTHIDELYYVAFRTLG